jgi:hypothetical protein
MTDKFGEEFIVKENTKQKVKAIYPHIVVGGDIDKPCYNIHWYDIEQKTMICGFSSYKLELVRKWLEEEFEVVERDIDGLLDRQQAEIERLKEELEIRNQKRASIFEISNAYERGRTKAIKEFAERLKGKFAIFQYVSVVFYSKVISIIDNLVKELEGDVNVD